MLFFSEDDLHGEPASLHAPWMPTCGPPAHLFDEQNDTTLRS